MKKPTPGTTDLTTGRPLTRILVFALPLVLGTLFQQLYNFADTVIVGRCLGTDALAAVGSTYSLNFLILGFVQGTCVGFGIPVAEAFGAKSRDDLHRYLYNGVLLCVVLSVVFTVATTLGAAPLLALIHTPVNIFADAALYIRVIFLGIPATVLYNYSASVLRSLGDSRHPFYFLLGASLLNIGLDWLLIVPCGMGVDGAAIATVASQLLSGVLCTWWFFAKVENVHFTRDDLRFSAPHAKRLAVIGLPMGFEYSVSAIGAVVMQDAINLMGSVAVAAQTAGEKIRQMFTLPMESVGMAMATYVGQNHGALRGGVGGDLFLQALRRGAGAGQRRPGRDAGRAGISDGHQCAVLLPWAADDLPQHAAGAGLQHAGGHFRRGGTGWPQRRRLAGPARPGIPGHLPGKPHRLGVCAGVLCVYGGKDVETGRGVGLLYESE